MKRQTTAALMMIMAGATSLRDSRPTTFTQKDRMIRNDQTKKITFCKSLEDENKTVSNLRDKGFIVKTVEKSVNSVIGGSVCPI